MASEPAHDSSNAPQPSRQDCDTPQPQGNAPGTSCEVCTLATELAEERAENERLRAALHTVHGMCRLNESRHFIGTYVEEVLLSEVVK